MKAPKSEDDDPTLCPIARSTFLMGDRWSILIVRELFFGVSRFLDLQAQTGATSQLLAARLKRLEADGLIERHAYSTRPPRHEYRLTAMGRDLMPIILALRTFGERWTKAPEEGLAVRMFHRTCGSELDLDGACPACGHAVAWPEMAGQPSPDYIAERRRRADAFATSRNSNLAQA